MEPIAEHNVHKVQIESHNTSNNGEHVYASGVKSVAFNHDRLYDDPNLPTDSKPTTKSLKHVTNYISTTNVLFKQYETNQNLCETEVQGVLASQTHSDTMFHTNNHDTPNDKDKENIDIVISVDVTTEVLNVDIVWKDMLPDLNASFPNSTRRILASTFDEETKRRYSHLFTPLTRIRCLPGIDSPESITISPVDDNKHQCSPDNCSDKHPNRHHKDTEQPGGGDSILNQTHCILDVVDGQIPRLGPSTLMRNVTFQESPIRTDESNRSHPQRRLSHDNRRISPRQERVFPDYESYGRLQNEKSLVDTQVIYNTRYQNQNEYYARNNDYAKTRLRNDYQEKHDRTPNYSYSDSQRTIISFSESDLIYSSRGREPVKDDHKHVIKTSNATTSETDIRYSSRGRERDKKDYKPVIKSSDVKPSERDTRYSVRNRDHEKNNHKPVIKTSNAKQIIILQKQSSCKTTDHELMYGKATDVKHIKDNSRLNKAKLIKHSQNDVQSKEPFTQYSKSNGCKTKDVKPNVDSNNTVKFKKSENTSVQINQTDRPQNVAKDIAKINDEESKHKQKSRKRKKRNGKNTKVIPKTKLELLQRQIVTGQIKSMFSRYKTDGLRQMVITEELHAGTFATKYKASYRNEVVVLSVFSDQETDDIDVIGMADLRNSYFIDGLKDCMTGPVSSSVLFLCKFHALGDLRTLLRRDQSRHVIGEIHAQFITAGVLIGLEYLHTNQIVHGNIKPSKVLLNNQGFPVLTGFLKTTDLPDKEPRDVFTPAFAAPERFRGNRDPAIDVFSVGCMAYDIVTGRTPFDGGSLEDTKENIFDVAFRPLYDPELISFAGELFVDYCLKKNVKQRFTIGENRRNLNSEEWFSTLDMKEVKRQTVRSPLLDAIQLIGNHAHLEWEEKTIDYNWGRVMDVRSPEAPTLDG